MQKNKIKMIKSLLAKINWLEEHGWKLYLSIMICGGTIPIIIGGMIYPGYLEQSIWAIPTIPTASIILVVIGTMFYLLGSFILPKILYKKMVALFIQLPKEEKMQVWWCDRWKYL